MVQRHVEGILSEYDHKFLNSQKKRYQIGSLEEARIIVATEDETGKLVDTEDPILMNTLIRNAWKVGFVVGYDACQKDIAEERKKTEGDHHDRRL